MRELYLLSGAGMGGRAPNRWMETLRLLILYRLKTGRQNGGSREQLYGIENTKEYTMSVVVGTAPSSRQANSLTRIFAGLAVWAACISAVSGQTPTRISDYVVFGRNAVTYQGFTDSIGAPVGTNGNLNHSAGIGTFTSLVGGGVLNGANTNARQHVAGDVIFNGNVSINELSRVGGDLHSGGNVLFEAGAAGDGVAGGIFANGSVDLGAFNQVGSIAANGDVTLRPSARVLTTVGGNGNVTLETAAKVDGHVVHSGTLAIAPLAMVGSSSQGSTLFVRDTYAPVAIPVTPTPAPSTAPPIVLPVFGQQTLAPGHYSDLIMQGSNKLFLSAGDYHFNDIRMTGAFAELHLDLSGGPINLFAFGDVTFNQLSTFANGVAQATADPSLAANVLLEAHGDIVLSRQFFGGVFAPNGDVTLRSLTDVVGAVVAGDEVIAEGSADVMYVRNNYLTAIPEPSSIALGLLGILGVAAICIRSRRHGTITGRS